MQRWRRFVNGGGYPRRPTRRRPIQPPPAQADGLTEPVEPGGGWKSCSGRARRTARPPWTANVHRGADTGRTNQAPRRAFAPYRFSPASAIGLGGGWEAGEWGEGGNGVGEKRKEVCELLFFFPPPPSLQSLVKAFFFVFPCVWGTHTEPPTHHETTTNVFLPARAQPLAAHGRRRRLGEQVRVFCCVWF